MMRKRVEYLMSIKPKFAYQIFTGKKKYELRRHVGIDIEEGAKIVLYVSGNVRAIMGEFTAGKIIKGSALYVWNKAMEQGDVGLDEDDWPYIKGSKTALAIEVRNPRIYKRPISLNEIRRIIPNFMPPLSYRILYENEPLHMIVEKLRTL